MCPDYEGLERVADELRTFTDRFSALFRCHHRDNTAAAHQYLCGLFQADRGNIERMEERVAGADYERLQHFISESPWDAQAVFDQVAREADRLLGGTGATALIVDESGFAKKGRSSVGVARQWNGRLGKVENCQVGVFGTLSAGTRAVVADGRLFLPSEWTDDPRRCADAGVPEEARGHRTKPELALDIVRRQRQLGVRFDYVCADGLYGNSGVFCRALDDDGETFLAHVHADQRVYLEDPRPTVPPRRSSRGRAPSRLRARCLPVRVDALCRELAPSDWERVIVRATTRGDLAIDLHRRPVRVWDGEEKHARTWQLVVRRDRTEAADIRYCLTNAPPGTPSLALARMEAQRFWIERVFEDGKSEVGMADYQVRGYVSWHHHMALVAMALLFLTRFRMVTGSDIELLSCHDIQQLLAHFLPRADATTTDILQQMQRRHRKRRSASLNAVRRAARARDGP